MHSEPHFRDTILTDKPRRAFVRLVVSLCLLPLMASGCGSRDEGSGGGSGDAILPPVVGDTSYHQAPLSCQFDDMKSWVHEGMLDYYLFADQVDKDADLDDYDSLEDLIIDLRVAPNDTFSYITDEQSHTARFDEGETVGFGWVLERSATDELYFKMVEKNSPLAAAGFSRGERLVSINDVRAIDFFQQAGSERDALLSSEDNGASARLTVESPLGVSRTRTVSKARYDLETVLDARVIEHGSLNVAYLHFYQFLNTSSVELAQAFQTLSSSDVNELVLDMRYNFGGKVNIATELASYIIGRGNTSKTFTTYQANDNYPDHSYSLNFVNHEAALNLDRVFVLQTDDTCSAAELVVNGLRPHMEVITVGGSSCGKPYASVPNAACTKIMNAIELEAVNADGVGGYYNGIPADCVVSDNVFQALGSTGENLLSTALDFMDSGACPSASTRAKSTTRPLPAALQPTWFGIGTF